MDFKFTEDGLFIEIHAMNKVGDIVYPHEKSKRGSLLKGIDITLTGRKEDYHIVSIEKFIEHIANGDFEEIGRVRMKPKLGGQSNGYAVRKAVISKRLKDKIEELKKSR